MNLLWDILGEINMHCRIAIARQDVERASKELDIIESKVKQARSVIAKIQAPEVIHD
jgi:hypothetical protein